MVELLKCVTSYGVNRRHIEIPKEYYGIFKTNTRVVVLTLEEYNSLKGKLLYRNSKIKDV